MGGPCGVGAVWSRELVVGGVADGVVAGCGVIGQEGPICCWHADTRAWVDIACVYRIYTSHIP